MSAARPVASSPAASQARRVTRFARLLTWFGLGLPSALALGCPGPAATPSAPAASPDRPAPSTSAKTSAPVTEPSLQTSEPPQAPNLSRAELLALRPADALPAGLAGSGRGRLAPGLRGVPTVALVEQLAAEGTPSQALDLVLVAFARAEEGLERGGELSDAIKERLGRDAALQTRGHRALEAWVGELLTRVREANDLRAATRFLEGVREVAAFKAKQGQPPSSPAPR